MRFYRPILKMVSRSSSDVQEAADGMMRELRKYCIEYDGFFSNHISWVVVPLLRCDVGVDEMRTRADRYATRRKLDLVADLPKSDAVITCDNINTFVNPYLKDIDALIEFFDKEVDSHGMEESIRTHLPRVIRGCGAGAFHPILQVGLGIESKSPALVSEGLAYMHARCWREADQQQIDASGHQSLFETIQKWCDITIATKDTIQSECFDKQFYSPRPETGGFQLKSLGCLTGLEAFKSPLRLPKEEDLRSELLSMFLFVSAATKGSGNNFFVLHGLTSLWACWHIIENVTMSYELKCEIVGSWMRGFLSAFVAQGLPGLSEVVRLLGCFINGNLSDVVGKEPLPETANWESIIKTAIPYDEEHILKGVWMMREMRHHFDKDIEQQIFLDAAHKLSFGVSDELLAKPDGNSLTFSSGDPAANIIHKN
eukprot:TRINITY_DN270_c0_g3_i1.p1 TRINITY_DN270_c0_g3~~TRINITY_DN270_c0_g3_i1.p1  ORF type:complete len:427 (+),score=97.61 TRINITY_DN270_c0_g3_i1:31-1311(+)